MKKVKIIMGESRGSGSCNLERRRIHMKKKRPEVMMSMDTKVMKTSMKWIINKRIFSISHK
jgi:hypothetical protein